MESRPNAIRDLKTAVVAIVTIRHKFEMPRDLTYQVVLDPAELSGSKEHIRLGNYEGDELRGWMPTADIEIREELKDYQPQRASATGDDLGKTLMDSTVKTKTAAAQTTSAAASPLTPPEVAEILRTIDLRAGYIIGACKGEREMRLEAEEIKLLVVKAFKGLRDWWHGEARRRRMSRSKKALPKFLEPGDEIPEGIDLRHLVQQLMRSVGDVHAELEKLEARIEETPVATSEQRSTASDGPTKAQAE